MHAGRGRTEGEWLRMDFSWESMPLRNTVLNTGGCMFQPSAGAITGLTGSAGSNNSNFYGTGGVSCQKTVQGLAL